MRLDKLAITAQEAFQNAMSVAGDAESAIIQPIHLLKALLDSDENNLSAIIKRIGADPVWLAQNVTDEIAKMPKQSGSAPMPIPSQDLIKVIDGSVKIAEKLGDSFATSEHLLIALSEDKTAAGRILTTAGVTRKNIEDAYDALRGDTATGNPTLDALPIVEQMEGAAVAAACRAFGAEFVHLRAISNRVGDPRSEWRVAEAVEALARAAARLAEGR